MSNAYKIIDEHVHLAGPGDLYPNDLYWSDRFEDGIGFQALKILKGWSFKKVGDQLMVETIIKQITEADAVDYAVVLAFDDVYDVDGTYRGRAQSSGEPIKTTLFAGNQCVMGLRSATSKLLPGISVHPFRNDALNQLDTYQAQAILCKLMPSAHMIDFTSVQAQAKLDKYYDKLAAVKLPLLLHTGVETSIPSFDKKYEKFNNPVYIERALDRGVTVILAHCGCSYFDLLEDDFVTQALQLFEKRAAAKPDWRLYADISALFSPFRERRILDRIFKTVPADRLIYGSDFPNPAKGRGESIVRAFRRFGKVNLLDRYFEIASKWLPKYYPQDTPLILTNFHRILEGLGRGGLLTG